MTTIRLGALAVLCSAALPAAGAAQTVVTAGAHIVPTPERCCSAAPPVLVPTRLVGNAVRVDGLADETQWAEADVATDFVQFEPNEGASATQRTEARVLYGDDALYVHIRAFDTQSDQIMAQLTRRDQDSVSDLLGVVIDSYLDRRTAFQFTVNPVGVKHDRYHFEDVQEDPGWDAVWDVATARDDQGWSAEFRIPYSQLRFREGAEQTWGINFVRHIARSQETSLWAPTRPADGAIVSRFGELRGLRDLSAPNRSEIMPYSLARVRRAPRESQNPFYRTNDAAAAFGADVKYRVTSNLTLDMTINPDFGQVDADPAQLNLTALETFLPERRPFFLEGASIFRFPLTMGDGDHANESLFYSRRVGRAPQGWADPAGGYADASEQTTILGAWKLSGKTSGGWSIGAMHAVTAEERARIAPVSGPQYDQPIEPLANYAVLRLQKDLRAGRTAFGVVGTALRRDADVAADLGLRHSALAGGFDVRHRFAGDRWQVRGYLLGSRITGSEEAIATAQRSPARYYQRPDAGHVTFDSTRTSLTGLATDVAVQKIAGGFWRFATGVQARTGGFEVNDVGFQNNADYVAHFGWLGYHRTAEQGPFRNWFLNLNAWHDWDFDGNRTGTGGNVNVSAQFKNFWHTHAGVNQQLEAYSNRMLRGGPLFLREAHTNFWGGFGTDARKSVQFNLNGHGNVRPDSDSWSLGLSPVLRVRPSGRASFHVGTSMRRNVDDRQWIGRVDTSEPHYVFGRLDQTTVGLTLRADYAFTPTLSLQLYAEPFVSAGKYGDFKQVDDPRAESYADRFAVLTARSDAERWYADLDGDGSEESFRSPDFNFKQFRSNVVLRWEYRPGSTLFVVWSQGRDHFGPSGEFRFSDDVDSLFGAPSDNVFMVKLSYWMSR